jgi:hypothetical protein
MKNKGSLIFAMKKAVFWVWARVHAPIPKIRRLFTVISKNEKQAVHFLDSLFFI